MVPLSPKSTVIRYREQEFVFFYPKKVIEKRSEKGHASILVRGMCVPKKNPRIPDPRTRQTNDNICIFFKTLFYHIF